MHLLSVSPILPFRFVPSNFLINMKLFWLLYLGGSFVWSTELQRDLQPHLVEFFSLENTSRPISPSQNVTYVDKQDVRVETGLFFDLNKDYDEDDCEEEKEKDCDGWWFWPFEADQNERASIQTDNLIALAQESSHGLFTGQNLDLDNVSTMKLPIPITTVKLIEIPQNTTTRLFTYRNSSLAINNSTLLKNSSYSGYLLPGTKTLPCFNGALIVALILAIMH